LVEDSRVVGRKLHEELNRHGERMLPLVEELLAEASWSLSSLDRLGVGIGPGSFTGLRIGVALATGIALGLDRPVLGVSSLLAMARAAPSHPGPTAAVLDARRDEYFVAVYSADGAELVAPRALAHEGAEATVMALGGPGMRVVGEAAAGWKAGLSGEDCSLPTASATALLASQLDPTASPALPQYVRGANAIKPNLPPSPLRAG
jgi:tRNA threonylcarbamoyladenosine biosynthesis protein TsaB